MSALCCALCCAMAGTSVAQTVAEPASAQASTSQADHNLAALDCAALIAKAPAKFTLTLAIVRERALQCNREVVSARRAMEAAGADVMTAGQGPNPNLTVGVGSFSPQLGIGNGNARSKTVDSSIRLDQVIERGNKKGLRTAAAEANLQAARKDWREAQRQQSLLAEQAFYDAATSQARAATLDEMVGLYRKTQEASERRLKAGDVAAAEVMRIQMDTLRIENDARQAQADARTAKAQLAQLLGLAGALEGVTLQVNWPNATSAELPNSDNATVRLPQRPDQQALAYRVEAATAARDLGRAQGTRDVTVGVQYDHYPTSATNAQGSGNTYSVSLSVPLFLRHRFDGEAKRAEVDYYAAQDNQVRGQLLAQQALQQTQEDLRVAQTRFKNLQQTLLPTAEKIAQSAEFAYRKGATSVLDLLDARRLLRQNRLETLNAQNDFAKALAAWRASVAWLPQLDE